MKYSAILTISWALATSVAGAAIDDCLFNSSVPVDPKGSTVWYEDVSAFNTRVQYQPAAIVLPRTVADVQAAVACAARLGVKVNPKGGGHSYGSFGLGGENGHLVIEMDRWDNVTLDTTTNIATIQAGARLGHVFTELLNQGGRAISHGTCPAVGVGGHSLHGGFGFSSFTHGLALDWMVGADVVLANSSVVRCSATENTDLFWALRGAGSSFGVVTTFYFNTFAAPAKTTVFQASLPWNASSCSKGWADLQDWIVSGGQPKEMNMRVFGMQSFTQLHGLYHGDKAALMQAIQPLMDKLGTSLYQADETDWYNGFLAYDDSKTVDITNSESRNDTFYANSLMTQAMPPAAMQDACSYWFSEGAANSRPWFIIIDMFGGKNGYITNTPVSETSFAHRDKLYLYNFYDRVDSGTYPEDGFGFVKGWTEAFTRQLAAGSYGKYANYVDPAMDRTSAEQAYYGDSLSRLQLIKAAVDPNQVFDYPQAVVPAFTS
ncbi:glucooligosaccharide oxidase [Grosmannia clavigera kw1407]|uniref:Glucooligosaccharide oxidase n=1 Tax=Grosmannia clavigera (strain kw1407 / UAMH 11150) TaxID=655863 RepID=F0XED9_GROCL|nr:glucooligosaccharide oxidase [Grosmannia clavigera kw1407]EFX03636.1 glucooligosaccharide oxidase [Grosmannia clavigera kw1407]